MRRLFRFSAFNLALGYVGASLLVLGLFATPLWFAWRSTIDMRRTDLLQEDTRRLTDVFGSEGPKGLVAALDQRASRQRRARDAIFLLADARHERLAGNLDEWPAEVPDEPGRYTLRIYRDGVPVQAMVIHSVLPNGYNLLVGGDAAPFQRMENLFWLGLAAAASIVLVFGMIVGLSIRRELLMEVQRINLAASEIVAGNLKRRLPVFGDKNELDTLSKTVNRMLDQIEQLIAGVRNVSNAIAHELRTPLTELRSRLEELSMTRPESGATFAEIETAVGDVDRVIAIFNALLRLAEIDTGVRRAGFVNVDVAAVVLEEAEFYQPVAEEKRIALACEAGEALVVSGDPLLLAQAVGNLVDNALKYSPPGTGVAIEARKRFSQVEISVADHGPGIPESERGHVTERFYRGGAGRAGTPGMGLGLTLVAAVAKLHGGSLQLADNRPGLRAVLSLPSLHGKH